jgi:hypothetical protein
VLLAASRLGLHQEETPSTQGTGSATVAP